MPTRTIYQKPRRADRPGADGAETVVTSTCGHNCGGRCVVNAHVVDDRIVRISTDPARWQPELPPLHACARGVGQIERLYHEDRLKYPMRRTGPRGSGKFERISWDAALDHVAGEMRRIRETYGNAAFLDASRSGNTSALHGFGVSKRFFYRFGGCTELWSNMSAEAEVFAVRMTFGAQGRLQEFRPRTHRLRQFQVDPDVGLESRRRHLRHRHPAVPEGGQEAGRAHRLRRSPPRPHQRGAGRPAHLHQTLDRCRRADCHGVRHRERRPARPGLLRPPRPGLRRRASARRRAGRRVVQILSAGRERRRSQDSGVGRSALRHPGRNPPPPRHRVRFGQAGGAALRLRPGAHRLRRAVPSRRLCPGGDHRQYRHRRRQLGRQQRRHRPRRHQEPAGRYQPHRVRRSRRLCWPTCWRAARRAATRPTSG